MKRVIYLNFDLESKDPYERLCYYYLESLGRQKKQVIKLLLRNSGMISSFTIPPPEFERKTSTKLKGQLPKKNLTEPTSTTVVEPHHTTSEVFETKPQQIFNPLQQSTASDVTEQPDYKKGTSPLTKEQIKLLKAKYLPYESLSDNQLRALATAMSEGTPVKIAFMQAQFSQ